MNDAATNPNMSGARKCPQCGTPLSTGALDGLCPACLLQQGAAQETATQAGTAPFQPPDVEEVARLFPQLEILGFLGKGGMGAVYKARQPALDRIIALKILPPHKAGDSNFAARFNREARALAKLSHPNIVTVHEFGQVNGQPFFLMEFVDGLTLRQLERAGKLSPREALQIVPQICEALQFAHDEGVVHRDIKPENILLDKKGRVKIADFGIAKIMGHEPDVSIAETEHAFGTPHYMAPEQTERPQAVDHRADIYSLGVVFYEMLTGELPLGKFSPPSSRLHGLQIDVRLDEVVLRALEKAPEHRYQHVSQVKTAVETIATTAQVKTPAAPSPEIFPLLSRWGIGGPSQMHEIAAHLTPAERAKADRLGLWFGIWNAGTFFLPFTVIWFLPIPVPLNWIIAPIILIIGLAFYPLWWKRGAKFLCSTAWAQAQGIQAASLRPSPWANTLLSILGAATLLIIGLLWLKTYVPGGVWVPALVESSIESEPGNLSLRVTHVTHNGQIVLINVSCEKFSERDAFFVSLYGNRSDISYTANSQLPALDCLLVADPKSGRGKVLQGTNLLSGKSSFAIGFVLPDEQAAAAAARLIEKFYLQQSRGLRGAQGALPLFSLQRHLGKDGSGKPIEDSVYSFIEWSRKSSGNAAPLISTGHVPPGTPRADSLPAKLSAQVQFIPKYEGELHWRWRVTPRTSTRILYGLQDANDTNSSQFICTAYLKDHSLSIGEIVEKDLVLSINRHGDNSITILEDQYVPPHVQIPSRLTTAIPYETVRQMIYQTEPVTLTDSSYQTLWEARVERYSKDQQIRSPRRLRLLARLVNEADINALEMLSDTDPVKEIRPITDSASQSNNKSAATQRVSLISDGNGDTANILHGQPGLLLNGATLITESGRHTLDFHAKSAHVRVPDAPAFHFTNSFTLGAWVYPSGKGGNIQAIIDKWDAVPGSDQRSYGISTHDGLAVLGASADGVDVGGVVYSNHPIPIQKWTHFIGTYDGKTLKMYLNGVLENSLAYDQGVFPGTNDLAIGGEVGGLSNGEAISTFNGLIDAMTLYNRALTEQEIQKMFMSSLKGKQTSSGIISVTVDDPKLASLPPVIVETQPVSGQRDVASGVVEIRARFNQEMADQSWSWSTAWTGSDAEVVEAPHYDAARRTCILKVRLAPGKTYAYWLNSEKFQNFKARTGQSAVPYLLIFQTRTATP